VQCLHVSFDLPKALESEREIAWALLVLISSEKNLTKYGSQFFVYFVHLCWMYKVNDVQEWIQCCDQPKSEYNHFNHVNIIPWLSGCVLFSFRLSRLVIEVS